MKALKFSNASLIRPVIVLPKASCGAHLDTPEKRQAFYKLQDEIWRTFLKKLENPIRQIQSKQYRIIEVLGAVRFYISHNTGEIHLKLRECPGNRDSVFEEYNASYNLDLPLYDINLVVEAFTASWNNEISQADKSFKPSSPVGGSLNALFKGTDSFYIRLTSSIRKAVQNTVFWDTLRHKVRDALKIDPEVLNLARRARTVRKLKHQPNLTIDHFNNVIKHIEGFRQLDKEAPNLLWLYTIALEEKVIPKGELIQALKKMLVYYSGIRERGWRLICKSNIRDFEPALETNSEQWGYLVEYIKLHNLLDRNQAIPRKALHLFNEPHWIVDIKNRIFYRGVEVKPALLNSYINETINTENLEEFAQNEAIPVFTWLSDVEPQLDKNQLKKGWPWLLKEATTWIDKNATEAHLSTIQWECKLGALTLGQYQFVPLTNAWQVREEAIRNRHCADQFIDKCRAGIYRLYSVYFYNGKHKATLGVKFEDNQWELHQLKSFANQTVSLQVQSIAESIAEGLNFVNEGAVERSALELETGLLDGDSTDSQKDYSDLNTGASDTDDNDTYADGSFCPICGEENGACNHHVACSDRFGGGIVGGVADEKKDELLAMVTSFFEHCIKQKILDCGLGATFNKILAEAKVRESEGEQISDILYEYSQPIEYAICELIDEDNAVYHTSWERDGMPGMSTIYDNYWAANPNNVLADLFERLIADGKC